MKPRCDWRQLAALLVLLVCLGWAGLGLQSWRANLFPPAASSSVSILLDALGDIRTFLAQSLWFKVDIYHHEMQSQGIPWTNEVDLLALYRVITTLDPRFVDAYDVGSYQLVMYFGRVPEGLAFLDEGLRNNPESLVLHYDRGFLMMRVKHWNTALVEGRVVRRMAVKNLQDLATLPESQRTPDERARRVIDLLNSLRMIAHAARALHDDASELEALNEWLRIQPGDPYPVRRLHYRALEEKGAAETLRRSEK